MIGSELQASFLPLTYMKVAPSTQGKKNRYANAAALILVLLVCYYAEISRAQILPTSRTVDWTQVGIEGGVPSANWPIYTTLSASGGPDDSVTIQTALDAAHVAYPNGAVVLLNPGTYNLHSGY